MKLTIATIITAATLATGSAASDVTKEYCHAISQVSDLGVNMGIEEFPLGATEDIVNKTFPGSEQQKRAYLAVLLKGYADGLLGEDPHDIAAGIYLACLEEIRS